MDKFYYQNALIGIRLTRIKPGSTPITPEDQPLQLVTLGHSKGTLLAPHIHTPTRRVTQHLQEALIVIKGKIKIDLYSIDKTYVRSFFLQTGQIFLLINGGYGVHLLEDSELLEFKNGPFIEDKLLI